MTATSPSVFAPNAVTRSWSAVQRIAILFLVAVFVAVAFTVGRATAPDHHASPVIAPSAVSVPLASGGAAGPCRIGRPC